MIVFSFSLYGANPKYTRGMILNAEQLSRSFPVARVNVYAAPDVPADVIATLTAMPNTRIIPVPQRPGSAGMFDRYRAIDDNDCEIMIVRDADSRVHARDIACIEDFLAAPEKLLHIIRDHKYHTCRIMGGTVAMRKAAIAGRSMADRMGSWLKRPQYMMDQNFLISEFYEPLRSVTLVHDRYGRFAATESPVPFRVPITEDLFVGQVHEFRPDGTEYITFPAN
jgi:hypothetical protein